MLRLIRAELRKYTTTRLMKGMALAIFVVGAVFAAIFGAVATFASFDDAGNGMFAGDTLADMLPATALARFVYLSALQLGYLLMLCIGVLMIGQEYRHKTATSTFLAEPRRMRVIGAKLAALSVIGVANGLIFLVGSVAGGGVLLAVNGNELFPDPGSLARPFLLALLVLVLWAWIGLGVGVLISNQIVALLVAIAFVWIVDPLVTLALSFVSWGDDVTRFLPGPVSTSAVDLMSEIPAQAAEAMGLGSSGLSWWAASLVLVLYALVMAGLGLQRTRRRDIA